MKVRFPSRQWIYALFFLMATLLFILFGFPADDEPVSHPVIGPFVSEILGPEESCMGCHGGMEGFAPNHDPRNIGCAPCHLGKPKELEADKAHEGMVLVPGNLSNVYQTCGTLNCHHDLAVRVDGSLMNTMSGIVAVNRFVFGETDSLNGQYHIEQISETGAADDHLRHLCASCHLGREKEHPAPVAESSRGGGCNACHLNYSPSALQSLQVFQEEGLVGKAHPALTLEVTNDHCFGCHSRSGRISTNYEGWHETLLTGEEVMGQAGFRQLADGRVFRYVQPDVHHTLGLECVDCHSATELMGDGNFYPHEEQAVKIGCGDCHFSQTPPTLRYEELSVESQKILALRQFITQGREFVQVARSGEGLINVVIDSLGRPFFTSKNSREEFLLSPPAEICTRGDAHDALACRACHTAWSPQCVGCHTQYEPEVAGFDLLDRKSTRGKWEEYLGAFFAEAPSLGVLEVREADAGTVREISTFIPGMIMTLDQSAFPYSGDGAGESFHRLFAPAVSHTISREGRSCESCHNDPLALGYGRGKLEFRVSGRRGTWIFQPEYADSEYDGLPQDAWIPFLGEPQGPATTRTNARPFRIAEQQRILTVGACLTCHNGNSKVMLEALDDFAKSQSRMSDECVQPVWRVGGLAR